MRKIGLASGLVAAAALVVAAVGLTAPSNRSELLKAERHFLQHSKKTYTGGQKAARMRNMAVVGHNDLGGRGFNADVWFHEGYAYVGHWGFSDWSSGSKTRFCPSPPKNGVPVVDSTNPSNPARVSRLVNPNGTSAEDVTVFEARYGPLAGHDIAAVGIQVCGGSRLDASFPRGLMLFDVTAGEPGEGRLPEHGLLHARPPRARVRAPRRPRQDVCLCLGAGERVHGGRLAVRLPRPPGPG
jgi:hypothetical protein